MLVRIALFTSLANLTIFIVRLLSTFIMEGVYGLSENKNKLILNIAVTALFYGIFLISKTPMQ